MEGQGKAETGALKKPKLEAAALLGHLTSGSRTDTLPHTSSSTQALWELP